MKNIRFVLLSLIITILFMPEYPAFADESYTYSYYMQVYDSNGEFLPTPSVPLASFDKQIELEVKNGLDRDDRFTLLCILNGEAQSFSTGDMKNVKQASFEIAGNETLNISLKIDLHSVADGVQNILHIVTIGLLDRIPKNEYDNISVYSHTISIPIDVSGASIDFVPIEYTKQNAQMSRSMTSDNISKVNFIPHNGVASSVLQIIYKIQGDIFPLNAAIYAKDGPMCVLFFLDGQLLPCDGKDGIILDKDSNNYYYYHQELQLSDGVHQLFAIWLPMDETLPAVFSTSEKIAVYIQNDTEGDS